MAEQAQISAGVRAVLHLRRLVWAYADRVSDEDMVRSEIVLSTFQRAYNEHRGQILAAFGSAARPFLPARVSGNFSTDTTQQAFRTMVGIGQGSHGEEVAAAMPVWEHQLPQWWEEVASPGLASGETRTAEIVRQTPPSDLLRVLHRYVETGISEGEAELEEVPPETQQPSSPQPSPSAPIQLPEERITGRVTQWQMPTWGWWAIGLGMVAAGGYLTYRIGADEGWWNEIGQVR